MVSVEWCHDCGYPECRRPMHKCEFGRARLRRLLVAGEELPKGYDKRSLWKELGLTDPATTEPTRRAEMKVTKITVPMWQTDDGDKHRTLEEANEHILRARLREIFGRSRRWGTAASIADAVQATVESGADIAATLNDYIAANAAPSEE